VAGVAVKTAQKDFDFDSDKSAQLLDKIDVAIFDQTNNRKPIKSLPAVACK
jgi:hypothetical protein